MRSHPLIRRRPRSRFSHGVLLSIAFAVVGTPVLMAKGWLVGRASIEEGQPAPVTVRVPLFLGRAIDDVELSRGAIVVARGEQVHDAHLVDQVRGAQPIGWGAWLTYLGGLFLCVMLYTAQLRRSHKGRLLRAQVVSLAVVGVAALAACAALLLTPVSAVALPVAVLVILTTVVVDLGAGLATALVAALVFGSLTPFDPGVITVLGVQGAVAALVVGERPRRKVTRLGMLGAGLVGGLAAAATYFLIYYLSYNHAPLDELRDPLRSAWLAAGVAGPLAAIVAIPLLPLYQRALGEIPLSTLVELGDLSNPLLKQIAEKSPGTWQHSLAMANMAEIAANTIGANGRLVRVGAYYHDLGKSLSPKYFVENLSGGEVSPHDTLPPTTSCDAIFSHVIEGVRVARRHGLHERVVDFMHMHHGDGLLEYFWAKCLEQGNPDGLTEEDFRYPGVKPHSKETAILAICDAVEAASRTLRNPDQQAIENLVQRIVYGKLHLGQLDESGLTVADLRRISTSLVETIKHAHHGRIEYPWQRKQRDEAERAAASNGASNGSGKLTQLERPKAPAQEPADSPSATQRLLAEPRLDSLDVPRPEWRGRAASSRPATPVGRSGSIETAPTEQQMSPAESRPIRAVSAAEISESVSYPTAVLTRPPTAAEVARATAPDMPAVIVLDLDPDSDSDPVAVSVAVADPERDQPHALETPDPDRDQLLFTPDPDAGAGDDDDEPPQSEWERALLLVTQGGTSVRVSGPPPPPGARKKPLEIVARPVTAHTVRRPDTDQSTEPAAEVTVQRSITIPREAVSDDDGDGPTRPREPIPFDPD